MAKPDPTAPRGVMVVRNTSTDRGDSVCERGYEKERERVKERGCMLLDVKIQGCVGDYMEGG